MTLFALTTAHRHQTLAAFKLSNLYFTETGVTITVPDKLKTSAPGRKQPSFAFSYFVQDKSLCVVSVLQDYLTKTKPLRSPSQDTLIISFKKPHGACSSQTISRWISKALAKADIDTKIFSPYSVKHAATSAAARQGLPLDIIRKAASWSMASGTFAKHYNRPLIAAKDFAHTVLTLGT